MFSFCLIIVPFFPFHFRCRRILHSNEYFIAAIGVGLINEWTDVDRYVSLGPIVHPDPARVSQYDAAYREWRELSVALTPFSHSLSRKAHS